MVALDHLVPQDHLVRKMEAAFDFSFIYDLVKDLFGDNCGSANKSDRNGFVLGTIVTPGNTHDSLILVVEGK